MAQVFISYRQLNDTQRDRVRAFAERVRDCGIDVVLDQFYKVANPGGPPEGWPKWSSDQAIKTERVLIIGNEPWFRCFDGKEKPGTGLGAACEGGNVRQRLYDGGGNNEIIRIVYFEATDIANLSFELKRYHRFHADDHFNDIIAWLGGTIPTSTPPPLPTPLPWPARCTTFVPDMANREEEFEFFSSTLCTANGHRGTIICGESDHGKTKLIAQFHQYARQAIGAESCCFVDFKGNGTVDHLLDTLALDLGGRIPNLRDRNPQRLREGLRSATQPVLLVFDTFEKATDEARKFVEDNILSDMGRASSMRILLAGQPAECPDPAKAAWQPFARRFVLRSIPDPEPWIVWATKRFPHLTAEMIRPVVAATNGLPGPTSALLENLGSYAPADFVRMKMK